MDSFVILQVREHSQIIIEQCSVGILRVFEVKFLHHHSLPQSRCINNGYNFWDTFRIQALWKFISTSTVLQVSKDSQIQCLFSGAAAFIGEGIDFTHTHVGHWKAMSCEECQENFRFERYIRFFFRTMVSLFTRTMWYRRGFGEKSVLNDIYTHSEF
jgi:hypothetical protein